LIFGWLAGCAPTPVSTVFVTGVEADAVMPSGDSWYVFRFSGRHYLRLPARAEAWNERDFLFRQAWLTITSPGGAFRPVQAVAGVQGHFYLLDAAQGRLCLYDTAAQLLSTFPLPQALPPFTPGRMEVFRGGDGAFTFVDYMAGEAWQFADRQGSEGGMDWVLRNRVKLPMGIRDCVQAPGRSTLSCALSGSPIRLDASLNRIESRGTAPVRDGERLSWDPDAAAWILEVFPNGLEGRPLFRFRPVQRRIEMAAHSSP
jgi:hypothetical protein